MHAVTDAVICSTDVISGLRWFGIIASLGFVADPVTVDTRLLINFTELTFHLFSKFGNQLSNNCSERNIT